MWSAPVPMTRGRDRSDAHSKPAVGNHGLPSQGAAIEAMPIPSLQLAITATDGNPKILTLDDTFQVSDDDMPFIIKHTLKIKHLVVAKSQRAVYDIGGGLFSVQLRTLCMWLHISLLS